jgi:hypothetical protein
MVLNEQKKSQRNSIPIAAKQMKIEVWTAWSHNASKKWNYVF